MTDLQLLTIALSVIIPVSIMIYSNSRVAEVSKRIDTLEKNLGDRIDKLTRHLDEKIDNAFDHMRLLLELHEAKHHNK